MVNGLYEADQGQESRKELAGNQRHELPKSDPPLSSGRRRARRAGWVDEKAGYSDHQSQVFEVYRPEFPELATNPNSIVCPPYEMDVLLTKPLPSLPPQRRSSPELRHPVHSEPERDSLWRKLRGTSASHSHDSSADPCRNDWAVVGVTGNATSSSSSRHSKLHGSLHSIPNGGDNMLNRNTSTLQDDASATYQPNVHLMPQEVSPEDPVPTKNYPLTNAASPSLLDMSPISPLLEYVHPPLTVASSTTLSHHGSSPGTLEHQEESAGGLTSILPSPPQSMSKEPNNTFFFFDSLDSDIQSLLHGMVSSVPIALPTENNISQLSLPAVQKPYQSEELDAPSVSTQPLHLRMYPSNVEGFIQPNGTENVSEVEELSSMTQSVVTKVYTPRSESSGFSPIAFSSTPPSQNRRTQLDSQCANNSQSPPDATQPSSAFRIPPFPRSSGRQTGTVTGPVMEMGDVDKSDTRTQNLEQSDAGQSFYFPDSQPWSPLDHLTTTNAIDLRSTGPQWYSSDHCPQAASQHQKWRPYCFEHNSSLVSQLAPKLQQVEELQELIRKFNDEWMQRMESQPGLWSLCSTLSSSSLFDRAMRTLKSFIRGSLAEDFNDVFAVMHLAFAAAFSLTWQQDDYKFSALCDDALQWQHGLLRDEDKTRFLNAMDCWRLHALEPPPLFASACHTDFRGMTAQESLYRADQQTLRDRLKKGEVFKAFIAFVDSKLIRSSFKT